MSIGVDVRGGVSETDAHPAHTHTHTKQAVIAPASHVAACARTVEPYAIKLRSQPAAADKAHVLRAFIRAIELGQRSLHAWR